MRVSLLQPNTRPAAPLCEKEKKKRKKEKERPLHIPYKPMTGRSPNDGHKNPAFNSGAKNILSFKYLTWEGQSTILDETSDNVRRMSYIIRTIILVPCWNSSKWFPRVLRYFLPCPGRHECIGSRYFVIGRAKRLFTSIQSPRFR